MAQAAEASRFSLQKDRMLRAAALCFNQKGFSGTSLKDVASHLGLTDAALYYYVKNKEELVYLCYLRAAELGREALDEALEAEGSAFDKVRRYLRLHSRFMVGPPGPVAIMSEIPSLRPEHRAEILSLSREHSARFERLLRDGIADGSIVHCDVRMTGNAIMGALNWIPKWHHGDMAVAEHVKDSFPDILSRGLKVETD
ncbi:MAG: TetR/AcrR family transcriptional regulator [Pseudomonadota bacterium]